MQKFKKVDSLRSDDEEEGMKVHLGLGRARSVFSRGSRVIGSDKCLLLEASSYPQSISAALGDPRRIPQQGPGQWGAAPLDHWLVQKHPAQMKVALLMSQMPSFPATSG